MTKKKFAELELSLLHLQQNVGIPGTHLIIHPVIQKAVEQAQSKGARPSINDIPPKLPERQYFPEHPAFSRESVDQVYPGRNETESGCIFGDNLSGGQLLAQFGESS